MRVLIIDDEEDGRVLLKSFFNSEGYDVWVAATSQEGLEKARTTEPDLIILDVILPKIGGDHVCQQIRSFSRVPILMVSAYARDNEDVIRGLNAGADDYLPKPIDFDLLKARVNALLRRSTQADWQNDRPAYVDHYLTIDLFRKQVRINRQLVSLSPLEFQLLEVLVSNSSHPVPSLEIVEKLWPHAEPEEYLGYVYTYIKRLRQTIERDPQKPVYIVTQHGLGYQFVPQISTLD